MVLVHVALAGFIPPPLALAKAVLLEPRSLPVLLLPLRPGEAIFGNSPFLIQQGSPLFNLIG